MNAAQAPDSASVGNPTRKKALGAVAAAVLIGGAAYGAYWALVLRHYESTDNAYVQGNVVQITPQLTGTVVAIGADETDYVRAGQALVMLDASDTRVSLEEAEAELARAVRDVRTLYANNEALRAQVALHKADVAHAEVDVAKAQDDVNRRASLVATGAVGQEEFHHASVQLTAARSALEAARAAVVAAKEQLLANEALTENTTVEQHPSVQRAAAHVREAYLALQRVELPAPVTGYVAKRAVQLGQRVQPGQSLMTIVPLDEVWVDANFKESQLRKMRIGQPATLVADVYGGQVEYHGTVVGLGAGTGSAFALLPAQNATGNWIKIVQRVPVRLALNRDEVTAHPLRVGLSMEVEVDVSRTEGKMLADAPRAAAVAETAVFAGSNRADDRVREIIAANLGAPGTQPSATQGGTTVLPASARAPISLPGVAAGGVSRGR